MNPNTDPSTHCRPFAVALILASASSLMHGCGAGQSASSGTPAPTQPPIVSGGATPAIGNQGPAITSGQVVPGPVALLSAKALSMDVRRSASYIDPKTRQSMIVRRDAPPDCFCAGRSWTVRRYELDGPAETIAAVVDGATPPTPTREQMLTILPGGVAITREINRAEGVEVVFDPPLIIMPDGLPPMSVSNAQMDQPLRMTAYELGSNGKIKGQGPARNLIQYVGQERVTTPAGTFLAKKIIATFTADLSPAKVSSTSEMWFVEGIGLVKEVQRETTRLGPLPIRSNAENWVLVEGK